MDILNKWLLLGEVFNFVVKFLSPICSWKLQDQAVEATDFAEPDKTRGYTHSATSWLVWPPLIHNFRFVITFTLTNLLKIIHYSSCSF